MLTATLSVNSYEKTNQDKLVQKLFCKSLSEANDCPKKATKKELNKKVCIDLPELKPAEANFLFTKLIFCLLGVIQLLFSYDPEKRHVKATLSTPVNAKKFVIELLSQAKEKIVRKTYIEKISYVQ